MYIFIAYKPNWDQYSMSCHVASYNSDFHHHVIDNKKDLIKQWTQYALEDKRDEDANYEYVLYINEVLYYDNGWRTPSLDEEIDEQDIDNNIEELREIIAKVDSDANNLYKAYQEQLRINKEQEAANAAKKKEEYERKEYEKLREKFGK